MTNKATHNGEEYEIGKLYQFSDFNHRSMLPRRFKSAEGAKFIDELGVGWERCEEINPNDLGKITDAPIELEDEAVYVFSLGGWECYGWYMKSRNSFFAGGNKVCGVGEVTNIVKLVPEVK